MSNPSFAIPGLGSAKSGETLPEQSFATGAPEITDNSEGGKTQDQQTTSLPEASGTESSSKLEDLPDAPAETTTTSAPEAEKKSETSEHASLSNSAATPSQNAEPPSLTHALEASLGLLPTETSTEIRDTSNVPQGGADGLTAMDTDVPEAEGAPEWEPDSSPYQSSDSTSSSSDDSDSDDDSDGSGPLPGLQNALASLNDMEDDDGEGGDSGRAGGAAAPLRTKNEMSEEGPPKPDVTITPEMEIQLLGKVDKIIATENVVLVMAPPSGQSRVPEYGSVVCKADRTVVAAVADVIGTTHAPRWALRFKSAEEITTLGLEHGLELFFPVQFAQFVFPEALQLQKGSDASNIHDEEVAMDEMDFSDDEKEQEYKRSLKAKRRGGKTRGNADAPGGGGRGGGSHRGGGPHPLRNEVTVGNAEATPTLNYDDEDGPYRPLARPAGFGHGLPPVPPMPAVVPFDSPGSSSGPQHGNRGSHRDRRGGARDRGGRGGRGRGGSGGGRGDFRRGESRGGGAQSDGPAHSPTPSAPYQPSPASQGLPPIPPQAPSNHSVGGQTASAAQFANAFANVLQQHQQQQSSSPYSPHTTTQSSPGEAFPATQYSPLPQQQTPQPQQPQLHQQNQQSSPYSYPQPHSFSAQPYGQPVGLPGFPMPQHHPTTSQYQPQAQTPVHGQIQSQPQQAQPPSANSNSTWANTTPYQPWAQQPPAQSPQPGFAPQQYHNPYQQPQYPSSQQGRNGQGLPQYPPSG